MPRGRPRHPAPEPEPEPSHPHASPELVRARELLADGRWHDYEAVVRELVKLVAPGRAYRAAEIRRVRQVRRRARLRGEVPPQAPPRVRPLEPDRLRETGARALVRKMFAGAGFEVDPPGRSAGRRRKRIRDPQAAARARRRR